MQRLSTFFQLSFLIIAASFGEAQNKVVEPQPLRTLIVSGGPTLELNQYAIESNARYVEKLTAQGKSQRVLFADGKRDSRTIPTYETRSDNKESVVLAWFLGDDWPENKLVMRASALKRLDGAATPVNIMRETRNLAASVQNGERGLIYFTGHGSENTKANWTPDYENTVYATWRNGNLAVHDLAPALQSWPEKVPLTLVMVQCHSGGFANLIFQGGDVKNGVWPRDFCGFFASIGEMMSSGCTSEVDEQDYQDFTTHFFAALSGVSRDGRIIEKSQVDFDKNGVVSGLEALAYTDLHDDSIDVPLCTSDVYLRSLWKDDGDSWLKTPYSKILPNAERWQEVVLTGLSKELKLSGEGRLQAAFKAYQTLGRQIGKAYSSTDEDTDFSPLVTREYNALSSELFRRFPQLKSKKSRSYAAAKRRAIAYLKTRPSQVAVLYKAANDSEADETRQAKLWRFVRMARTVILQERVKAEGTSEQKAMLARLRASESRNCLK